VRRLATLPNLLGVFRLLATPVVLALVLWPFPAAGLVAFILFVPAALSDLFDGRLARSRGQVTTLGAFLDLTADKVLVSVVLVALVAADIAAAWVVALIIGREFLVAGVRQVLASARVIVSSQVMGKAKTVVTLIAIGALLLAFDAQTGGPLATTGIGPLALVTGTWLLFAAMLLTVLSGADYLAKAWPLLAADEDAPPST